MSQENIEQTQIENTRLKVTSFHRFNHSELLSLSLSLSHSLAFADSFDNHCDTAKD